MEILLLFCLIASYGVGAVWAVRPTEAAVAASIPTGADQVHVSVDLVDPPKTATVPARASSRGPMN